MSKTDRAFDRPRREEWGSRAEEEEIIMKISEAILNHQKKTGEPTSSLSKRSGVSIDTIYRMIAGKNHNSRNSEKIMEAIDTFNISTAPLKQLRFPKK